MINDSKLLEKILSCTMKNEGSLLFRRNCEYPATEIIYRQNRGEQILQMITIVLDEDLHLSRNAAGLMCCELDRIIAAVEETK